MSGENNILFVSASVIISSFKIREEGNDTDRSRCFILEEQHLENIASYIGAIAQMLKDEQKKQIRNLVVVVGQVGSQSLAQRKTEVEVIVQARGTSKAGRESQENTMINLFGSFVYVAT